MEIITTEELNAMLRAEEQQKTEYLTPIIVTTEIDGLLYRIWRDRSTLKEYAVREIRTLHMGFNSNEDGKLEEFIDIVEREGACRASWGVTGRTAHLMLAYKLREKLPQYRFEISYDRYLCEAHKCEEHKMMPMPGTTEPDWGKKHWGQE